MSARLRFSTVLQDSAALFMRNATALYVDFLAAAVAATTLYALLLPGQAAWLFSGGRAADPLFFFINPYSVISSILYAIVSAAVLLRLWRTTGGPAVRAPRRSDWAAIVIVALVLDHLTLVGISLAVLPGIALAAVTCVVMPALVIEHRGIGAVGRSLQMTAGNVWTLTAIWGAVLVPWIAILVAIGQRGAVTQTSGLTALWLGEIMSDLITPVFVGFSICLSLTIYRALLRGDDTAGGSR